MLPNCVNKQNQEDYCAFLMAVFGFLLTEFDLEKEKSVLDEQGLRIAENQENSQKNRRKLAESTRGMPFYLLNCLICIRSACREH